MPSALSLFLLPLLLFLLLTRFISQIQLPTLRGQIDACFTYLIALLDGLPHRKILRSLTGFEI